MEWFLLDVRQAIRALCARPGFTAAALIVLAVGIGANAATFSIVRGLLLQPLPYPDSENVVAVGHAPLLYPGGAPFLLSSDLPRLWDEARSFEQLASYTPLRSVLEASDGAVSLDGAAVTPSLFPLLRAVPRLGRLLADADAVEGAHRVVLLSHDAWTTRFGADPDIVGAPVDLNNEPHTVAGVLSSDFEFEGAQFWTPLVVRTDQERVENGAVRERAQSGIGRLRPGVSPEQATAEVRTILARAGADRMFAPGLAFDTRVTSLREQRGRPFRLALLMLSAATGLVLLMACANVAGLVLARGIVRARELAVRGALGAARGRIVRQLLTESVLLSVAGGAVGVALAAGTVRAAPALGPPVPGLAEVGVDLAVVAFAIGLSVVTGLLFGAAPALAWSRVDLIQLANDAHAPGAGGFGRQRANKGQALLATGQIALALVLLTTAGLLLRSFVAHINFDRGFDPTNLVSVRADDPALVGGGDVQLGADEIEAIHATAQRYRATLLTQMERLATLPGVEAVALASSMPLSGAPPRPIEVAGRPASSDARERLQAGIRRVSPGYADAVRLRLLAGRFFTERDTAGNPRVAVVSESFAREAFGGESGVGQRLIRHGFRFPGARGDDGGGDETWEVIGVVADVSTPYLRGSSFWSAVSDVYLSMLQPGMEDRMDRMLLSSNTAVIVRTADDPREVVPFLRDVLTDIHPGAVVTTTILETRLSADTAQPRFYAVCAGIFGAVALLLAAFGLYSLLIYTVSQRRREIGVRMALGAGNRAVVWLVLRQGGVLVGTGVTVGLLAASAATRIVEHILFGVTPADPLTFIAVTTVLLTVGLVACWLPARQATRIDPMDVLRDT